jgi:hypothetical protein
MQSAYAELMNCVDAYDNAAELVEDAQERVALLKDSPTLNTSHQMHSAAEALRNARRNAASLKKKQKTALNYLRSLLRYDIPGKLSLFFSYRYRYSANYVSFLLNLVHFPPYLQVIRLLFHLVCIVPVLHPFFLLHFS